MFRMLRIVLRQYDRWGIWAALLWSYGLGFVLFIILISIQSVLEYIGIQKDFSAIISSIVVLPGILYLFLAFYGAFLLLFERLSTLTGMHRIFGGKSDKVRQELGRLAGETR